MRRTSAPRTSSGSSAGTGERNVVYTADRSGYVGFGVILGVFFIMTFFLLITKGSRDSLIMLGLLVAVSIAVFVWLRAFRIEIVNRTSLTYSSLTQRRTVALESISSVELSTNVLASPLGPSVRLVVLLNNGEEPLTINAKVFGRDAIARVRDLAPQ